MLLPLGSPLPNDAVSAVRGESGMLGRLSVPRIWGHAVPPDDHADEHDGGREAPAEPRFDFPRTVRSVAHFPVGYGSGAGSSA